MFDAYTIKKVLPRLVAAIILIQLSWFLFTGAIAITNVVSFGLEALIAAPFGGFEALKIENILTGNNINFGVSLVAAAGIGAAGVIGAGGFLALGTFILMALLVGFFVLILRRIMLIALLLLAPLALVAWILPGTQRLWKMWWDNFSKLLLMFPMILVMLIAGRAMAEVAASSETSDGLKVVLIYACVFTPYFLIPLTYKAAGAGLGFAAGFLSNATNPANDYMRKRGRQNQAQKMANAKAGEYFKRGPLKRLNTPLQYAATPSSLMPGSLGNKGRGKIATNMSSSMAEGVKILQAASLQDDVANNEFAQHGHSLGALNSRIKQLKAEGNHALASTLTQYTPYAGNRAAILGAMKMNAGFGKLSDKSLKALDRVYGDSQADTAAKQAAFGDLIFTSKGAGNYMTYASRIGDDNRVHTYSDADYRSQAQSNLAKSIMEAGPGVLSQIKPYKDPESGISVKDATAEAMAMNAINAPDAGGQRPLSLEEHARAMEGFVSASMEGAYNDPNMKASFDRAMSAIQKNPEALKMYKDAEQSLLYRGMDPEEAARRRLLEPPPGT